MKKLLPIILLVFVFAGCNSDDNDDNVLNVAGTWRAPVMFSSCTPADVCAAAGFLPGSTANAVLVITQDNNNRSELEGSYTYEGAGISATIDGDIGGNQLMMNGSASNPFGTITVVVSGNVSGNTMSATVSHQISLIDGRSGTVNGAGTFVR